MLYTTLNKIRACNPCSGGWGKLLKHLGKTSADDEPLSFIAILESNGFDDALWCARSAPEHSRVWRLLAVAYVRDVQRLMTDQRSIDALDVAERHANGQAKDVELAAAGAAAWAAARDAAGAAAGDVAGAATWAAARAAAWAAAWDAASGAEGAAAWAAGAAASAAAWAAGAAAWARHAAQFREAVK